MLAQKVNAKNIHRAAKATIDPFDALDEMGDEMHPRTPFPGAEGIPFDAEILYARRAAESKTHPELNRLEVKFGFIITGYFYRTRRGSVALSCVKDGFTSTMQTGVSFEAFLTLPNLREPSIVKPIPDTTQYVVTDDPKKPGWIVDPDKGTCGCQIIFHHEYECRHSKAVYKYQAENTVSFQKKTPADFPEAGTKFEKWLNGEPLGDELDEMVTKHHPEAICNGGEKKDKEILTPENIEASCCSICGRMLTNPLSCRLEIGPECRKKIHTHGEKHLADNALSDELIEASKLWKDEKFQKWVIKGCLTLGASLPVEVVCQKGGNQFWGVKSWPHIYYKDCHGIICVLNYDSRKLKYRAIDLRSMQTPLDQMVQRQVDELAENGGKEVRTILL